MRQASPFIFLAKAKPRSSERLATVIDLGCLFLICSAQSSIISPAPIKSTFEVFKFPKMRSASLIEAAAIEIELIPISVLVLTSLATENVF